MIRLRWTRFHSPFTVMERWECEIPNHKIILFLHDRACFIRKRDGTHDKFNSFAEAAPVIKKLLGESNVQSGR